MGIAAVVVLLLVIQPSRFATAVSHFSLAVIPVIALLSVCYYLLQGVRWWTLLRAVDVHEPLGDTILINYAGQATGLLPLGELTRAVILTDVADAHFGSVVATITVQELIYTLIIIALGVPGSIGYHAADVGMLSAFGGTCLILLILTVPGVVFWIASMMERVSFLCRAASELRKLHLSTVALLQRWDTWLYSVLSVFGALVMVTAFWVIIENLDPGLLSWQQAAFVYAVATVVGAATLSPGGLGSFEAAAIGLLYTFGATAAVALAAALLMRVADKGLATFLGIICYLVVRVRYGKRNVRLFRQTSRINKGTGSSGSSSGSAGAGAS